MSERANSANADDLVEALYRLIDAQRAQLEREAEYGEYYLGKFERAVDSYARIWDSGFQALSNEYGKQREDPSYPINRNNPYGDGLDWRKEEEDAQRFTDGVSPSFGGSVE